MKEYGTLQEIIEDVEYRYKQSFEFYPGAPLARAGFMLGEHLLEYPKADKYYRAYMYVCDLLAVDLIIKKITLFIKISLPKM